MRVFEGKRVSFHLLHGRIMGQFRDILSSHFPSLEGDGLFWMGPLERASRYWRSGMCQLVKWSSSGIRIPKLNVDGCSRGNPGRSGGGGILRDAVGCFVFAFSSFSGEVTILQSELRAKFFEVKESAQRRMVPIHVESDPLLLVQMVRGEIWVP